MADKATVEPDDEQPIFAPPTQKARKTMKVTKGGGPSTKVDVSFKNLTVSVNADKGRKNLVNNVSGFVPAGELLVVMGASGSGKSTLLQTIANVKNQNFQVTGDVFFNSRRLRPSDRRQILSFVSQESPLLGEFTVSETLWFAARLYFGYFEVSKDEIQAKIDDIIDAVSLGSCRDVIVGNLFFRGLSGGQKKRLSIAVELISSPSCLILDEPTTGLDSSSAYSLIQSLRELAKLGHTVVASVHQPSSKMWSTFSNIMLMSQGHCVYYGSADGSVDYFAGIGYRCPDHFNPADYFSAVLSTDFSLFGTNNGLPTGEATKSPQELADLYSASAVKRMELTNHLDDVDKGRATLASKSPKRTRISARLSKYGGGAVSTALAVGTGNGNTVDVVPTNTRKYDNLTDDEPRKLFSSNTSMKRAGFFSSFLTLLVRFLMSLYREPGILLARIFVYVGLGLILGLVYLDMGKSYDTEALLGRASVCLGLVGFFSFLSISAIPFIMDNRAVMDRERKNGAYPIGAYVLADVISMLPATAVLTLIAALMIGFMVSLNNLGPFFLGLWTLLFAAECLVQACACVFTKMESGIAAAVGLFAMLFLCSGFFVPVSQMSWAIRWIAYVSPMHYAFRMFMHNEVDQMSTTDSAQFPSGEALLLFFEANESSFWTDLGIIFGFAMAYIVFIDVVLRFFR